MSYNNQSYQKTMAERIATSKIETLMVMLYEGMITKIKQARERFDSGQNFRAKEAITRAMRIADALMENINLDEGGETAQNLEKLYYYIISELASANRETSPETHLDNALRVTEILHQGWKDLESKTS